MYDRPTSLNVLSLLSMAGMLWKNDSASSTVIDSTSEIDFPLNLANNVSELYLSPLHSSHFTKTSGRNCISIFFTPAPSQASHLPPGTLKENLPGLYPISLARGVLANNSRIGVKALTYVAALDLGVLPIGD